MAAGRTMKGRGTPDQPGHDASGETTPRMASWTASLKRSALQDMLVATSRPGVISFALGLPSADLFPAGPLGEILAKLVASDPRALQYGPPASDLRAFVAGLMLRRGVRCAPEQVFLTAGAQQGMSLLAHLLLDPGSSVILEDHSYTGFQQVLAPHQPRILTVPTGLDEGIDVGAVERHFECGARPALLYAMSDAHNPVGASMPLEARERLVSLARSHRVPILEDDAYGLLSYDGEERPAMRAFDPDWVLYLGSFSKTLAPALRTGWVVVPERLVGPLASLKESSDIDTATLGQRAAAAFVATGAFDAHLAGLRSAYAHRRDTMLAALERSLPKGSRWSRPRAGFFIWVELPGGIDASEVFEEALERHNVAFLPGPAFAVDEARSARSSLRLNFSFCRPEVIEEGIARLGKAVEAVGRKAPAGEGRG